MAENDLARQEQTYRQCLDELGTVGISSHSLNEYAEKAVQVLKEQLDFLFAGISLLDTAHLVRFYKGTGDMYEKRMGISLENSNPVSLAIRNGRPLVVAIDNDKMPRHPAFPDEKLRFFLPLKCPEGVFGALEIISVSQDEDGMLQTISNLENLATEIVSSCLRFMDKSEIGFWTESNR